MLNPPNPTPARVACSPYCSYRVVTLVPRYNGPMLSKVWGCKDRHARRAVTDGEVPVESGLSHTAIGVWRAQSGASDRKVGALRLGRMSLYVWGICSAAWPRKRHLPKRCALLHLRQHWRDGQDYQLLSVWLIVRVHGGRVAWIVDSIGDIEDESVEFKSKASNWEVGTALMLSDWKSGEDGGLSSATWGLYGKLLLSGSA